MRARFSCENSGKCILPSVLHSLPECFPDPVYAQSSSASSYREAFLAHHSRRKVRIYLPLSTSRKSITPRSIKYVNQIISKLAPNQLHLSTPVASVQSLRGIGAERDNWEASKILLITEAGEQATYDHVIMACHSDAVLKILRAAGPGEGGIREEEERILGAFQWNHNEVILHNDIKVCN